MQTHRNKQDLISVGTGEDALCTFPHVIVGILFTYMYNIFAHFSENYWMINGSLWIEKGADSVVFKALETA